MNRRLFIVVQCTFSLLLSGNGYNNDSETSSKIKHPLTLTHIRDAEVIYPSLVNVNFYALATTPFDTVYIARSSLPSAGLGVFAARPIAHLSYFGPYSGNKYRDLHFNEKSDYAWEIPDKSGNIVYWIDGTELSKSNWLRFVNCPNTLRQQNLLSFVRDSDIFYLVIRNISVGEELLVYYGDNYARRLGIDTTQFSKAEFENLVQRHNLMKI